MKPPSPEAGRLSRRDFLRMSGFFAAGAALGACAPLYSQLAQQSLPSGWAGTADYIGNLIEFQHLSRLTFGPRISDRQLVAEIGLQAWMEEQLAPKSIDDGDCDLRLRPFDTLEMKATELVDWSDKILDEQDRQTVPAQLRQATLIRQVYSHRQLYEIMVAFWSNHFNISTDKGDCWFLKTVDDREVIRPHALGNFRDLLWASAHSPAMLVYLDNQSNHKDAPNENYARELMELHCLGVDGGYSQKDVMELARCLTGWTIKEHFWRGDFTFDPDMHDTEPKYVLGLQIHPGGQSEAEFIIEKLASHPATAHYIARKLARYFIADQPPPEAIANAAQAFIKSDGDIPSVLRSLLNDGLAQIQPKFKRPTRFIVSALRALNAQTDGGEAVQDYQLRLGQPYFGWPTPDGYPVESNAWLGNLMPRWEFAYSLPHQEIDGAGINFNEIVNEAASASPQVLLDRLSLLLFGAPLEPSQLDQLLAALTSPQIHIDQTMLPASLTAILLASPQFQWY